MFLSVFDIFKIGVGPSSSHTMGPMTAAARFLDDLRQRAKGSSASQPASITVSLHGSLAFTGKGHATDRAVILGLCGFRPDTLDPDAAEALEAKARQIGEITPAGLGTLKFAPATDLVFDFGPPLEGHANGLVFRAFDPAGNLCHTETYYSVGGGFVLTETELRQQKERAPARQDRTVAVPYPFGTAREMLAMGAASGKSIADKAGQRDRRVRTGPRCQPRSHLARDGQLH